MRACLEGDVEGDGAFDPKQNIKLRREIIAARQAELPENYIQRVIQFARQGYRHIEFPAFDTDWQSEAYLTVSGQNANNSVRVTDALPAGGRGRPPVGAHRAHHRQGRPDGERAGAVGQRRRSGLALRRSRRAVRHHDQRLAHLPGVGTHQRLEPVLGVHVPRRHGVQSGVAQPDAVPQYRRFARCRGAGACDPAVDRRARDLGDDGAVPLAPDRRTVLPVPHAGPGLRQSRRAADGVGPGLRQPNAGGRSPPP